MYLVHFVRVKVTYVTVLHVGLRKHDVCLVLTVRAKMGLQERFDWSKSFVSQSGVDYVRGCEVEGMLDENGRVIEEGGADYLSSTMCTYVHVNSKQGKAKL